MLLQVDGLRKSFGRRPAVDGVGFSLDVGEIVGFLGPNGAGKTTTMRMIAGYLEPDEGAVKIFNIDVAQERRRAQERLGYLPEGAPLYGEMTPWTYLRFIAEARGMSLEAARHAVRDLIKRLGEERGLIISTHSLEEVEAVCTRAIVIDQGRVVADDTPANLVAKHGNLENAFAALTRGEERA